MDGSGSRWWEGLGRFLSRGVLSIDQRGVIGLF